MHAENFCRFCMKKSGTTETKPFRLFGDVKAFLDSKEPHQVRARKQLCRKARKNLAKPASCILLTRFERTSPSKSKETTVPQGSKKPREAGKLYIAY